MFREADQLLPTLLSGSVKNEMESVDKESLPMGMKCYPNVILREDVVEWRRS